MSGEADEDTMSAWSSLNGGGGSGSGGGGLGSPGEIGSALSLRRRSSLGMQMASFSENPLQELQGDQTTLDSELAEVGRGSVVAGDGIADAFGDIVERVKEARRREEGEGGEGETGREGGGRAPSTRRGSFPVGGALEIETGAVVAAAAAGSISQIDGNGTVPSAGNSGAGVPSAGESKIGSAVSKLSSSPPASASASGAEPSKREVPFSSSSPAAAEAVAATAANTTNDPTEGRRRSNQDDQSNDSDVDKDSARGADSTITGGSVEGVGEDASRGVGSEYPSTVQSAGSDARWAIAMERQSTADTILGLPLPGGFP